MSKNKKTSTATATAVKTKDPMFGKKLLLTVIVFFIAAAVITGTLVFVNQQEPELSEISNETSSPASSSATIKNGGFDYIVDANKTGAPYVAQNWTLTRKNNSLTIAGIVPTESEEWNKIAPGLSAMGINVNNPGVPETEDKNDDDDNNFVYMISNREATYANIKNYTSFSVSGNSYNKLTVWIKTADVAESESEVYIWLKKSSSSTEPTASFTSINTHGEWQEYTFYIEGKDSSSQTLYIEVGLGINETEGYDNAKGTIFIDNIVLASTTKGDYNEIKENETEFVKTASFYSEEDIENKVEINTNGFETITSAQYIEETDAKYPFASSDALESTPVYKLVSDGTGSVGGSLINPIAVAHPSTNTHYRLSFYVRTTGIRVDQGVNIYLYDCENKGDNTHTTYFSKVRTSSDPETDVFNGWVKYSFYVKPSNIKDFTLQLEMWFGNMINPDNVSEYVKGTLYVTEIALEEITLSEYSSASTGSQAKKVDLSSSTFTPQGSATLTNGSFDFFATNVTDKSYPHAVSDWSAQTVTNIGDVTYGIVVSGDARNAELTTPITDADFAFNNAGTISQLYINNNILTSFGISSSKITLAANSYYRISVAAKELGGKAYAYLAGDVEASMSFADVTADGSANYSSDKITLENGFVQFNFYIATGEVEKTVYLNLYNGAMKTTDIDEMGLGAVVFDMADYVTLTEDEFKALSKESDDNDQVFEAYDRKAVDENGNLVEKIELVSKYSNVLGFDFLNEKEDTRDNPPADEIDDADIVVENTINWLTIILSAASLLMIAAVVYVIIVIVKRNRKHHK